jgi:uncharacterized protein (TIRG00374 family)
MKLAEKIRWVFWGSSPAAQRLRRLLKIGFLLILFAGLFWIIPLADVLAAILAADPRAFLIGFVFSFISTVLTAAQIRILAHKQGIHHSLGSVLSINLAAKFYSLFSPGTIVASGVKWYRLAQPDGKTAEALAALGFFRVSETFLNLGLGLVFLLASGRNLRLQEQAAAGGSEQLVGGFNASAGWIWLVLLVFGLALFWIAATRLGQPAYAHLRARSPRLWQISYLRPLLKYAEKLILAAASYADMSAWGLSMVVITGVVSQLSGIISNLFIAQSVGINLSFVDMGWIYSVTILVSQLPFAFAGGLGVREVTLVAILALFGVGAETALAFSLLLFLRGVLIALIGGFQELLRNFSARSESI